MNKAYTRSGQDGCGSIWYLLRAMFEKLCRQLQFQRTITVWAFFFLALTGTVRVVDACEPVVGKLVTLEGRVEVQRESTWSTAQLDAALCQGDTVRAGERSRATVQLINQAVLRIDQNTAMRLDSISGVTEERSVLSLLKGAFQSFSRKPRGFEVNTPYLNGSIEGTEFVFRVEEGESILTVFEGIVLASNDQGRMAVGSGESASAQAGQAPQSRTVVRPRDAAQWALYYPPILAAGGDRASGISLALQQAAADLSVGRVDAARGSVNQAINTGTDAGLAYALLAVINVVQNQQAQALADANQAVSLSPDSAAAKIALSYAQQANFQIAAARDTLQQAVTQQPEDALARARLAELQLMLGDREQASASAQQAVALAPDLGRTQITLGFAALAEFRNEDAAAAFENAIALDSADPLPHLGLGLSKISTGDLEAGRKDIEVAVGLDSNNALLRSYLGKAYFEEKRAPLDFEQFDIAKQLDPNDPTAYLYSGIARQTQNRPVEALQDIETSIKLNDNRAAYRGRLLLDKDRAARGTSLSRVHRDVGFAHLAINESSGSLQIDPSNASAHRFLSDSYQGVRRREISRVSELLQAQLMQDININPIQPSVSATNLNIVTLGGPAAAGFNEFTPLFERNKAQLNATGFGGNNDTAGGEAVVSALYDQFSFSLGAFSYDTDGWRPNNDLEQKIYDAYAQWAVTPDLNIQVEYRNQESDEGDLAFNFDPVGFVSDRRLETDRQSARIGLRFTPTPASSFLFSYIHSERDEKRSESDQFIDPDSMIPFNSSFSSDLETDGYLVEGQYIYQAQQFNLIVGGGYSNPETTGDETFIVSSPIFPMPIESTEKITGEIEQPHAYVYSNIGMADTVIWTVGASYDDLKDEPIEETSFNPKFGVRWDLNNVFQLRAAAFKVLKPSLVNNRTIEPTQVAGFNQFFDDATGTEATRYGVAVDAHPVQNLSWGAELTWRDLDVPSLEALPSGSQVTGTIGQDEQLHRVYLYWTPARRLALTAEAIYDSFEEPDAINDDFRPVPAEVKTISVPLGINYFHPNGFFAGVVGTYVDQEVVRSNDSIFAQGDDNFFLTDVSIGYRFPKRRGIASLGIKNLFDEEFSYQDDSYREFTEDASTGPYFPERLVMGRVTLNF